MLNKRDQVLDAASFGVGVSLGDPFWVVIDADSARPKSRSGGDHDTAVSATEVINDVVAGDAGQLKHSMNYGVWCRDIGREAGRFLSSDLPDWGQRRQDRQYRRDECYASTHFELPKPT